jgi:hypothetical protein
MPLQTYLIGRVSTALWVLLGAEKSDVLAMVLRQGLALIGLGLVTGFMASLAFTRWSL